MGLNAPTLKLPPPKPYKIRRGDKLEQIARKHGFKDYKAIWDDEENVKLKKKRRKPESIQPGDVLKIPPPPKEVAKALADYNKKMAEHLVRIQKIIDRSRHAIKLMERHKKEVVKDWIKAEKDLKKMYGEADKWAKGVDVAATVINLSRSLTKLAQAAHKASQVTGKELAKVNKEVLDGAKKDLAKKHADAVGKVLSEGAKGSDNAVLAAGKIAVDSWFKMTSPSFWGWTVASIIEGKSWSEAVTSDPKSEYKKTLKKIRKSRMESLAHIEANIARQRKIIDLLNAGKNEEALKVMTSR